MKNERVFLSYEQVVELFEGKKRTHTFLNSAVGMLIGADWDISDVLKLAEKSKAEIGGERCRKMKHGLILWRGKEPVFVECDDKKLTEFELANSSPATVENKQ